MAYKTRVAAEKGGWVVNETPDGLHAQKLVENFGKFPHYHSFWAGDEDGLVGQINHYEQRAEAYEERQSGE